VSSNAFHDHLDVCQQCREHPFELCPKGALTFRETLVNAALNLPLCESCGEVDEPEHPCDDGNESS
jgi:hypothetical protein